MTNQYEGVSKLCFIAYYSLFARKLNELATF